MTGGYIQLIAKGVEDVFITGDPQISMFTTVYRRYSNFAMELIDVPTIGKQRFGEDIYSKLPKRGDILGRIYFKVKIPDTMVIYQKELYQILNEIFNQYGVENYSSTDVITVDDARKKIKKRIDELSKEINFYNELLGLLNDPNVPIANDFELFDIIMRVASNNVATAQDLTYVLIYQSIIQSSENKVEPDGTYNLLLPPDLTGYIVELNQLVSNKTRGMTHIIMTTNEIIKAMYSYMYFTLFGGDPTELRFIQNVFTKQPTATSFDFVTPASKVINVFDTIFNIRTLVVGTDVLRLQDLLGSNSLTLEDLLNTPFYIRFNTSLNTAVPGTLLPFKDLDAHKYMTYYMNLQGPTVADLTISLTAVYFNFRVLIWADIVKNFILSFNTFLSLDQNNGPLVLIKREDSTTIKGDLLEYTDFFYGPLIQPSVPLSPVNSIPIWPNPNNPADSFWSDYTGLRFRQTLQDPSYFEIATGPFPIVPITYPSIADLTIASNQSIGFINTVPYLNNYNLFLDSIATKLQKDQHSVFLEMEGLYTTDEAFGDFTFNPLSLTFLCGQYTLDPNVDPFNLNVPGNNFFQNNYYKTFIMAPDVDPRMLRIRYINGAVAVVYRFIKVFMDNAVQDNISGFTSDELTAINTMLTSCAQQISPMLTNYLFPRIDPTQPYSPTNDRTYILFNTMLNSIPTGNAGFTDQSTLNTDINFMLSNQPPLQNTIPTVDTFPLYQLYYVPPGPYLRQFIHVYIYWKDKITGEEFFEIYTKNIAKLIDANMNTFSQFTIEFLSTQISKLNQILQRFLACAIDKNSLNVPDINELFTDQFSDLLVRTDPVSRLDPIYITSFLFRNLLSSELGFTEPWDSDPQPPPAFVFVPFIGPPVFFPYTDIETSIDFSLQRNFTITVGMWYNTYFKHKTNYNNVYKYNIMNTDAIENSIGSTTSTRITNSLNHLVTKFNEQIIPYNEYIIANTPPQYVPILKQPLDPLNIDYTKFSFLPLDIVTGLPDYEFIQLIRNELDSDPSIGYNDIRVQLANFVFFYDNYNWRKTLFDLTLFAPPANNLLFTDYATIDQYYIDTMISRNALNLAEGPYPITIYGIFTFNGVLLTVPDFGSLGLESVTLTTFFNYMNTNFYTIGDLWNYFNAQSVAYITLVNPPDLSFSLMINQEFWNSVSPINMFNNLGIIEKDNPFGFRFTDLYIKFLIKELFGNISFIKDKDIGSADRQRLVEKFTTLLQEKQLMICKLHTVESEVEKLITSIDQNSIVGKRGNFAWLPKLGHIIPKDIRASIGDQEIEKIFSEWLEIYYQLNRNISNERGYNIMIGNVAELTTFDNSIKPEYTLRIPLPFWFCRYSNYHIPLVSSQYQDIIIRVSTRKLEDIIKIDPDVKFKKLSRSGKKLIDADPTPEYSFEAEYFYLSKEERHNFAINHHEYLIEYVQNSAEIIIDRSNLPPDGTELTEKEALTSDIFTRTDIMNLPIKLHFNNNCKYLVWSCVTGKSEMMKNWLNFGFLSSEYQEEPTIIYTPINNFNYLEPRSSLLVPTLNGVPVTPIAPERKSVFSSVTLKFNGMKRLETQVSEYYDLIQPYSFSSGLLPDGCGMYSFSLDINMMQPSGSVNLTKIDDFTIYFNIDPEFLEIIKNCGEYVKIRFYAITYNVLRFLSGMCGRAFFI
jgi:hypothetical protein